MSDIKVGDELWFASHGHRRSCFVEVKKVGRKWLTLSYGYRCDRDTLKVEGSGCGYGSLGQCYRTKEEHDAITLIDETWSKFTRAVRNHYRVPKGASAETIQQAAKLLGIELEDV